MSAVNKFTCISCRVAFNDAEIQRKHYKCDWHRYNLKRKVASLPPIPAEEFQNRVLQYKTTAENANSSEAIYCMVCKRSFTTKKSFENHKNSKKHKENEFWSDSHAGNSVPVSVVLKKKDSSSETSSKMEVDEEADDEEIEEVSDFSDDGEISEDNPIANGTCLFCSYSNEDLAEVVEHMTSEHTFFIPDIEYLVDLNGLLLHLGEKLCRWHVCLWCEKAYPSLLAVRNHMNDKGHTKMLHEGSALVEYTDFYDYSASYPDNESDVNIDSEVAVPVLDDSGFQLVLPSGASIGHRSLMKYYRQNFNPHRQLVTAPANNKLAKIMAQYRALGWNGTSKEVAARKAKDIKYMHFVKQKFRMKVGVKANKLQTHFRPQVIF